MDKNWLIRTKSNHILGPVSKEKVLELYHNGSIKPDDEVCSGNGYWFFIREDDLVGRFLLGPEVQGFNPISEAKDVLTQSSGGTKTLEPVSEDITMVGGVNISMLQNAPSTPVPPVPEKPDLYSQQPESVSPAVKETVPSEIKKKNNVIAKPKTVTPVKKKPLKKQNWLKYIGYLGFVLLLMLVYFRKSIIEYLFHGELTQLSTKIISVAHAQEAIPEKKKSF